MVSNRYFVIFKVPVLQILFYEAFYKLYLLFLVIVGVKLEVKLFADYSLVVSKCYQLFKIEYS